MEAVFRQVGIHSHVIQGEVRSERSNLFDVHARFITLAALQTVAH